MSVPLMNKAIYEISQNQDVDNNTSYIRNNF